MVYVLPNTLIINPASATTTATLNASVWYAKDPLDTSCTFLSDGVKTKIHLLRRKEGQSWAQAITVLVYDCSFCCLDNSTWGTSPTGFAGWYYEFPSFHAPSSAGIYEYIAADQGDLSSLSVGRTATMTIEITQDPSDPCLTNPCLNQCDAKPCSVCPSQVGCTGGGTTCDPGDYVCQIIDYVKQNPIVVVAGVVVLYLLMSPPKRR
jgi:hypothetical protein